MGTVMRQHASHRRWVWLGVLFVVLGGVLGMHGLGGHGLASTAPSHSAAGHSAPVTVDPAGPGAGHAAGSVTAASIHDGAGVAHALADLPAEALAASTDRLTLAPGEGDVPMGAMVGLCLAVLLVGAVTWALLTRPEPCTGVVLRLAGTSTSRAATGRDREPPTLTMLCVRRC